MVGRRHGGDQTPGRREAAEAGCGGHPFGRGRRQPRGRHGEDRRRVGGAARPPARGPRGVARLAAGGGRAHLWPQGDAQQDVRAIRRQGHRLRRGPVRRAGGPAGGRRGRHRGGAGVVGGDGHGQGGPRADRRTPGRGPGPTGPALRRPGARAPGRGGRRARARPRSPRRRAGRRGFAVGALRAGPVRGRGLAAAWQGADDERDDG
mmetsp:Transcript_68224/g.209220  ORF Transcript_68224/g.209220 Transcript_68224/m.209220 type:complete len:206 (+) Transcript_68224:626-1243(+)